MKKRLIVIMGMCLSWSATAIQAQSPPVIQSYSPLFGLPGTTVTIQGTGFGQSQGNSYVSDLAPGSEPVQWPTTEWSDTGIVAVVPNTAPEGKIYLYVTVNNLDQVGTFPFTVGIPPSISTYAPSSGNPGTLLTINGAGFGETQGKSFVSVLSSVTDISTTWTPTQWSDTQIVVRVPNDMPLGKVYLAVTVNGLESIGTYPFTVGMPPIISKYYPYFGNPETIVKIKGSGFGRKEENSFVSVFSAVTYTWNTWRVKEWCDTEIDVAVLSNMPLGKVYLYVTADGLQSIGTFPFTVGIPPSIKTYSPSSGETGTQIVIRGDRFGPTQGSGYVALQSTANVWTTLTVVSWTDCEIVASVPKLTPNGLNYISVTSDGLQSIGTYPFIVQ